MNPQEDPDVGYTYAPSSLNGTKKKKGKKKKFKHVSRVGERDYHVDKVESFDNNELSRMKYNFYKPTTGGEPETKPTLDD